MDTSSARLSSAQRLKFHEHKQQQKHREPLPAPARPATRAPLGDLALKNLNSLANVDDADPDALADQLSKLYIAAPPVNSARQASAHSQSSLLQGPKTEQNTFDHLDAVQKERSSQLDQSQDEEASESNPRFSKWDGEDSIPEPFRKDPHAQVEINKHLHGQYEWLISYPAQDTFSTDFQNSRSSSDLPNKPSEKVTFGCNLLSLREPPSPRNLSGRKGSAATTYTLIATPLRGDPSIIPQLGGTSMVNQPGEMQSSDQPPPPYKGTPSLGSSASHLAEPAASPPALSAKSSFNFDDTASPALSHSGPRIEDSLAELDDLEDELEAISRFANSKPRRDAPGNATGSPKPQVKKESGLASPATLRVKATADRVQPTVRRAASLTLRDKTDRRVEGSKVSKSPESPVTARPRSGTIRASGGSGPIKSTKPLTKPSFELPGEAVSRRLKELREAREAQQAEAQQKTSSTAPRIKSSKPLTRPAFELPGEAISRRKREEREAKLKAQEEEEQKRREFKARPNRANGTPSTLPRETIASRARQDRIQNVTAGKSADANTLRRLTAAAPNHTSLSSQSVRESSTSSRGRHSVVFPTDNAASRGTSASTALSGKRSSVSIEDMAQHKLRGKEVFDGDRNYLRTREMTKLEREAAAKNARDFAAERSRAITREWAERKRQKEATMRQAMKSGAGGQGSTE